MEMCFLHELQKFWIQKNSFGVHTLHILNESLMTL
jgi:hypothetical protein